MAPLDPPIPEITKRPYILPSLSRLCPFHIDPLRVLPKLHALVPLECLPDRASLAVRVSHLAIARSADSDNDDTNFAFFSYEMAS